MHRIIAISLILTWFRLLWMSGFCTPGLIMSAVEIVGTGKKYTREELKKQISGHLCRCTGYENILNAMERIIEEVYQFSHKE